MTEAFLQYIWEYGHYSRHDLLTTDDEPVEVLHAGRRNTDAGPDFTDARIRIGDTLWAGQVELHLKSSSWLSHGHAGDERYANVVLHVVYEADRIADHTGSGRLPTLVLKGRIDERLWESYRALAASLQWLACGHRIREVPGAIRAEWLQHLHRQRLQRRAHRILDNLRRNRDDWEESFYQDLSAAFGLKANTAAFLALAHAVPLSLVRKHGDSLTQVEALLFGQSGMLAGQPRDTYVDELRREHDFLRSKFRLSPGPPTAWKFLRMRPAAFPTLRLAQLAAVLQRHPALFTACIEATHFTDLRTLFLHPTSPYWQTRYRFGPPAVESTGALGEDFFRRIVINVVAPYLLAFSQWKGDAALEARAYALPGQLPAEDNAVIRMWKEKGLHPEHADHSQALLELKTSYCEQKKCVNCTIGKHLISKLP